MRDVQSRFRCISDQVGQCFGGLRVCGVFECREFFEADTDDRVAADDDFGALVFAKALDALPEPGQTDVFSGAAGLIRVIALIIRVLILNL